MGFSRVLFELLSFLSPQHSRQLSPQRDFLRHFLPLAYQTLNQLAYLPLKPAQDYAGAARVWNGVLWLRLDYLAMRMNMERGVLYAVWGSVGVLMGVVGCCGLLLAWRKAPSDRFRQLFLVATSALYVLVPVPVLHLLMADSLAFRSLHSGNLVFRLESTASGVSAICLALFVLIFLLREIAMLEPLCHPRLWLAGTHSSLSASLSPLPILLLSSLLYLTVPAFSPAVFYGLFALLHALIAFLYFARLPMYKETSNLVVICMHMGLAWGGFAMIVGLVLDSDLTAVSLVVGVTPALCYILNLSWTHLYSHKLSHLLEVSFLPHSRNNIALIVRAALLTNEEMTIQQAFHSLHLGSPDKESWIGILEACYCLEIKADERLARLKLAENRGERDVYWEDSYMRFKLWQFLANSSLEEIIYMDVLQSVETVQSTDEALCRNLSEFWVELASQESKQTKLNSLIDQIAVQIRLSEQLYEEMLSTCPDNPDLLANYASFLRDISLKPDKAKKWESKAEIAREAQERLGVLEVSFGLQGTGVLVFDLGEADCGKVVHCNQDAALILQYDYFSLSNLYLSALLPEPFSTMHVHFLKRFSAVRKSIDIRHPQVLPLLTAAGFALEVSVKLAFTSVGGAVLLILGFKKAQVNREIALMTSEGAITAVSQGFAELLRHTSPSLGGTLLSDLCPALIPHNQTSVLVRATPAVYGKVLTQQHGSKAVQTAVIYTEANRPRPEFPFSSGSQRPETAYSPIPAVVDEFAGSKAVWPVDHSTGKDWLGKQRVKQGLHRTYALLGSVTVLTTLLMLAWTIAISLYLITVTQGVIQSSVTIELSARIVHTTRLAGQGRFLDQTNAGFFSEEMTKDVKNVIYQSIVALTAIEEKIWTSLETLPAGRYKDMLLESRITTWELSGNTPQAHKRNLVNAMKVFLDHSGRILDLPISNLTIHSPSVFFLVRNGLKGELISALSQSLALFKTIEQAEIDQNVSSIIYLLIAVFASLGLALAISVPVIMRLQVLAGKVSSVFTSTPLSKCVGNYTQVADRLRDKFGVELEYVRERQRKRKNGFVIYRPVGPLALLVVGYLSLSLLLYLVIYFQSITALTAYVGHLPEAMQLYAQRFAGLLDLWTWTVEAIFSTSHWPLTLALPESSLQLAPTQVIALTYAQLKTINRDLFLLMQDGYLPYTDKHNDLFIAATNYSSPILRKGIRPGFGIYSQDIRNCATYKGISADMYTDCGNLYSAARDIVNVSSDILTILQTDFEAEALARAWKVNYWLLAWAVFGLLLVAGLLPVLHRSRRHLMRMVALGRLVPGDLLM